MVLKILCFIKGENSSEVEELRERHGSGDVIIDMEENVATQKNSLTEGAESVSPQVELESQRPKEKKNYHDKPSKAINFKEAVSFIREVQII